LIDDISDKFIEEKFKIENDISLKDILKKEGWDAQDDLSKLAEWMHCELGEGFTIDDVSMYHYVFGD